MQDFWPRKMFQELSASAEQYPVVTVTGPRQSGKTELVRHTFPNKPYANLESPDLALLARTDPRHFLAQFPDGAILDEIQNVPELLSYLQVIVDERKQPGMYILTGSQNLALSSAISQSLAGRTAVLELLPFALNELPQVAATSLDQRLLQGLYPRIVTQSMDPTKAYRQYVQTYLERDVRKLSNIHNLVTFQSFMKLCAGRIGQLLNKHALANELGLSANTVENWLTVLEASYIITRLQPFHSNLKKRLVKMPKLYFCDVGLACYLLGIESTHQLSRDPMRGQLFENLIVLEAIKQRLNRGLHPQISFYRDNTGNEVDLLLERGHDIYAYEIKVSSTFHPQMLRGLHTIKKVLGNRIVTQNVIYAGEHEQMLEEATLRNYQNAFHEES